MEKSVGESSFISSSLIECGLYTVRHYMHLYSLYGSVTMEIKLHIEVRLFSAWCMSIVVCGLHYISVWSIVVQELFLLSSLSLMHSQCH